MKLTDIVNVFNKELVTFHMLCNVKTCTNGKPMQKAFDPSSVTNMLVNNMKKQFPEWEFMIKKEKLVCTNKDISFDIDMQLNVYYHIWIDDDFFIRYDEKRNMGFYGDDQIGFKTEEEKEEFRYNLKVYKAVLEKILG